ncbi:MAG TPA: 30S ribosomal protein S6--L-glutamate ligase [Bdellovibrionota bacterium]|jgi:ribosomal protein S6--L-glutamate ligase|nr:30S ribosomal protein S6--L-glutamate ligase [Bdellovibrionota bacterium]
MKIGILSTNARLYSTARLVEAAIERGHEVEVINTLKCYMDITSQKPMVLYKKRRLDDFDAVIPRIGASITFYGLAMLRQFEMMGVFPLNESVAIGRSRDKLRALQLLSRKGLGMPRTSFAHSTHMTEELIDLVGGAPLVLKLLEGTQGKGVVLAETKKAAESVIDAFREMEANFLVQEFVTEARGEDIRCFVIGDKVVASMIRRAKEGEFRSNLHRGGTAESVKITPTERETAVKAAKILGLNVAGVDLLRSKDGPKIMEVNSSPGLQGIETSTGKDVAAKIIEFIEKNLVKGEQATKTKNKG